MFGMRKTTRTPETTDDHEAIYAAWNSLEDALNWLEELGEDPHLSAHVGGQEVHGQHGKVRFSHTTERWGRVPRDA